MKIWQQIHHSASALALFWKAVPWLGIYTAGVLDVFLEAGIMPDVVVGVSAGALHGCSYVAGQKGRSTAITANTAMISTLWACIPC